MTPVCAGKGEDVYTSVAPKLASSELDKWLDGVADVKSVDAGNLHRMLAAHWRLIALLKGEINPERRSFGSKYLHFRNPSAVFIFD